jgi:hypothetical protein
MRRKPRGRNNPHTRAVAETDVAPLIKALVVG